MITVSIDELINQKVLPYDIFDADSAKIFSAGEIMTPGKIMVIRNYDVLYRQDDNIDIPFKSTKIEQKEQPAPKPQPEQKAPEAPQQQKPTTAKQEAAKTVEVVAAKEPEIIPVNKYSIIEPKIQLELKSNYRKIATILSNEDYESTKSKVMSLRDDLINGVASGNKNVKYCSELKLVGEHLDCHALNTAIYSIYLANKLDYGENAINEIVLGALLHDIGKTKLPKEIILNPQSTRKQRLMYESHTIHGYKIIKYGMKLPTNIARVALEHHETMDGNGWPYGISNTMISDYAQIVAVANSFDNISSAANGGESVKFSEALRTLLKKGSKIFSPKPLYTFVHMFSYSDNVSFKDLLD